MQPNASQPSPNKLKDAIYGMIRTGLVEPYRRKHIAGDRHIPKISPGNWYGLQLTETTILNCSLFDIIETYRMNDELCDMLKLNHGSECSRTEIELRFKTLDIPGFNHPDHTLEMILADLPKLVSMLILRA